MKVVFFLPDLGSGGAERVVSILSNELIKSGYSVGIAMLFSNRCHYNLPHQVEIAKFNLLKISRFKRYEKLRNYFVVQKKLYNKVVAVAFQDTCLNYVLISSIGINIKVIATERNNPYIKGTRRVDKLKASVPFLLADYSVFQTEEAKMYYSLLKNSKSSVIINPIIPINNKWIGKIESSNLISVCRLHGQKNLPMTLDVLSKLKEKYKDIHIDIFGEGPLKESLEVEINNRNLQDNVTLRGVTENVVFELSKHSVFISTSDYEGISNSMLEAMSVGMPIVCTDCPIGGARMMLSSGRGMLSPVGDINLFVRNLDYVLSNPEESKIMANKAYQESLKYTPHEITKKWCDIFDTL